MVYSRVGDLSGVREPETRLTNANTDRTLLKGIASYCLIVSPALYEHA